MKADHGSIKKKMNIAKGQLEGISRMIDNDCYCIDVSNQLLAVISLLKHANNDIIKAHLERCVISSKDSEDLKEKMKEIEGILSRMSD